LENYYKVIVFKGSVENLAKWLGFAISSSVEVLGNCKILSGTPNFAGFIGVMSFAY